MKIQRFLLFVIFISFTFITIVPKAQVTIGSDLEPNPGALLDLKEKGITAKGLGLPRVELKELDSLKMGTNSIANRDGAWDAHAGLLVYNTNKCVGLGGTGTYVWDGALWQRLPWRNQYDEDALYQPNSYLIESETETLQIPVEKAFRIWEYYGSEAGGNRLPAESVTGVLTPVLYWQDAPIVLSNALSISGNDREAIITVKLADGTVKGNAVVALKDGSGTIRWSWHIWVTDDPTKAGLNGGGFTWMDRNLGATTTESADVGVMGLTYQWGRKDPFPMAQVWRSTSIPEPILQKGHGELADTINLTITNEYSSQINFYNSINNPLAFIRATSINQDWYSTSDTQEELWNERWDRTVDGCFFKSPFDPCPRGWKVPTHKYDAEGKTIAGASPWQEIISGVVTGSLEESGRAKYWEGYGVYPLLGYRIDRTAKLTNVTQSAYAWSGSVSNERSDINKPYTFYYNGTTTNRQAPLGKGWGFSVRCVKE